jgi:phospho-N-acetylmuramoyl-pentapeptide-transferase
MEMTDFPPYIIDSIQRIFAMGGVAIITSLLITPIVTKLLYRWRIARNAENDPTLAIEGHAEKINTPIMGGIIVVITIAVLTFFFDWERRFTYVPIGVMLLGACLGAIDDILGVFAGKRRDRSLKQTITLAKVHQNKLMRVWYWFTVPYAVFKGFFRLFGSKPGKGVHAHEKLMLQFAAGAISAWWIYLKLGDAWQSIYIPFHGFISVGFLIIPLVIGIVVFTANAVNITDGMDGLAGGMLIPTFSALALLSWKSGMDELAILNAITAGSLVTYTYFNIKPARFQMGDVGSLALGSLLAINTLAMNAMAVLPLLAFTFYAEAFSVIIQVGGRVLLGKRIFKMAPIHHHFELKGWSEEKTIMRFWLVHIAFVIAGVWVGLH